VRAKTVPALVVATLVSLAIAVPDHAVASGSGGRIRSSLNVIGPQNGGGEPSVAISPDHTIYVSAPGDAMEFWRSADGGKTWAQGASPESPSGDTSVNVDGSGAVYESNLNIITGDQNAAGRSVQVLRPRRHLASEGIVRHRGLQRQRPAGAR